MNELLDFRFYATPSAHNWTPYLGNSVGHIKRSVTHLISIEKIQNLCSNSSSECVLSKAFGPCPKIPYHLKVFVETVTEGHFSTHFLSDYVS